MAKTRVCALVALMISVAAAFSPASMAPLGIAACFHQSWVA